MLKYILAVLAAIIAVLITMGLNPWYLIVIYWLLVFVKQASEKQ